MCSDEKDAVVFRDDPRFNILLAKSVHKHPCLYDYTISEYTSKASSEKAWLQVADEVNETICCCKTKWRNMRSVFVRKQRMKPNIRGKPYYLNEYMKYLLPFLKGSAANPKVREEDNVEDITTRDSPSPPHTEFVVNEEIDLEDVAEDDTGGDWTDGETNPLATNRILGIKQEIEESAPALTWSRRRKKSSKSQIRESVPGTSRIKKQKTSSCCEDEPRRMFLLSLVPEVDEFTETQMRSFKRRVLDLIDEISEC